LAKEKAIIAINKSIIANIQSSEVD